METHADWMVASCEAAFTWFLRCSWALVPISQRTVDHLPKACTQSYIWQPFANQKAATFLYVLWFAISWLCFPLPVSIGISPKCDWYRPAGLPTTTKPVIVARQSETNPAILFPFCPKAPGDIFRILRQVRRFPLSARACGALPLPVAHPHLLQTPHSVPRVY
jgi:hypothetical protein